MLMQYEEEMTDEPELTWQTCTTCGCQFQSDGDPVCGDRVCQALRRVEFERVSAVRSAEQHLNDAWMNYFAEQNGL